MLRVKSGAGGGGVTEPPPHPLITPARNKVIATLKFMGAQDNPHTRTSYARGTPTAAAGFPGEAGISRRSLLMSPPHRED